LQSTEQQRLEHNKNFEEAAAIVKNEILLQQRPQMPKPGWLLSRKLNHALSLFDRVLELNPENWPAMWNVGKVHQRMGDNATALSWFERAYQINPSQPDVAREAALCAMEIGRHAAAIVFAHRSVQIEPTNGGRHTNLALAYCSQTASPTRKHQLTARLPLTQPTKFRRASNPPNNISQRMAAHRQPPDQHY
jgi:tetratricopeptide (TPR) repeat protein